MFPNKSPSYIKACEICGKLMRLDRYKATKRLKRTCSLSCRGKLSAVLEVEKRNAKEKQTNAIEPQEEVLEAV